MKSSNRVLRTLAQLVVGGGLTALIQAIADLKPTASVIVMVAWTSVVSFTQNYLEDSGAVKDRRVG